MRAAPKIIDAYPEPEPVIRPQCEAPLNPQLVRKIELWEKAHGRSWYRYSQPKPKGTCTNKARYLVKGKWYCRKHAGLIALEAIAEPKK